MDDVCLDRWESLLIRGNETSCEQPLFLNAGEGRAFARCRESNLRLEQERIPQTEILQVCASLG